MELNENIVDSLIEINKLKEVLGYKDLRSIQTWCRNKSINIIVLGKKNYITKDSWESFLQRSFNHNGESNLADQKRVLAGKNHLPINNGGSFTKKRGEPLSSLDEIVTEYKSKING